MRALVTGAAGGLGMYLVRGLLAHGWDVTGVDDLSRGRDDADLAAVRADPHTTFVAGDLTDPSAWDTLGSGFDAVYHLAAVNGTRTFYEHPARVLRVNLLALMHGLDWAARVPCGRFIWTSSSEVYAGLAEIDRLPLPTPEEVPLIVSDVRNPRWSYATSKIAGEALCTAYAREHHVPVVVVRPHNIYGPRMGWDHVIPELVERARGGESPLVLRGGDQTRSFCYGDDAAEFLVRLADAPLELPATVHLGNGLEEVAIVDLARRILAALALPDAVRSDPAPEGSVARRQPDTRRIEAITGYRPRVTLDEGLRTTIAWYAEHPRPAPAA